MRELFGLWQEMDARGEGVRCVYNAAVRELLGPWQEMYGRGEGVRCVYYAALNGMVSHKLTVYL